jgi:hypothetical protein
MTFDINSRMDQWTAASKSQHADETERILKSDTEKFQRIAPLPEGRDAASRAALFALIHDFMTSNNINWEDLNEFRDFGESGMWFPADNEGTAQEMGAISAARDMEQQKMFNEMDLINDTRKKNRMEDKAEKESQEKADNLRTGVEKGKAAAKDAKDNELTILGSDAEGPDDLTIRGSESKERPTVPSSED